MRNDFSVEVDNRVIKTSPYESHAGNLAPRSTSLHNRILVRRRDDDDKQPRFQQAWFLELMEAQMKGLLGIQTQYSVIVVSGV